MRKVDFVTQQGLAARKKLKQLLTIVEKNEDQFTITTTGEHTCYSLKPNASIDLGELDFFPQVFVERSGRCVAVGADAISAKSSDFSLDDYVVAIREVDGEDMLLFKSKQHLFVVYQEIVTPLLESPLLEHFTNKGVSPKDLNAKAFKEFRNYTLLFKVIEDPSNRVVDEERGIVLAGVRHNNLTLEYCPEQNEALLQRVAMALNEYASILEPFYVVHQFDGLFKDVYTIARYATHKGYSIQNATKHGVLLSPQYQLLDKLAAFDLKSKGIETLLQEVKELNIPPHLQFVVDLVKEKKLLFHGMTRTQRLKYLKNEIEMQISSYEQAKERGEELPFLEDTFLTTFMKGE